MEGAGERAFEVDGRANRQTGAWHPWGTERSQGGWTVVSDEQMIGEVQEIKRDQFLRESQ